MNDKNKTKKELLAEIEKLHIRLRKTKEPLRTIRSSRVGAVNVSETQGEQVLTPQGNEHSYRVLVEIMNEGAATLTDKGIILYSNPRLASILKIPLKIIMGMPFNRFIPKTDKLKFAALLEKGKTGNSKGKISLKCKDGLLIPVQVSMRALDIHDTKGICLAVTTLSEQKRNKQILKSEQLSRSILEQAGEAIVVCDMNGIITHASNSTSLLCNTNPLLKPFEEIFNLQFKAVRQTNKNFSIKSVLEGKSFHGIDAVLLLKSAENPDNSKNLNLLINAAPLKNQQNNIIGCVITLVDVTELKQIEDALREREEQLSGFFNSSPAGMAIVDSNLKFVKINYTLADINGLTANAHYGKTIREVLPELAPTLEPLYQQVLSNGKPILNLEVSGETPLAPGILRHWMVSYFPIIGIDKKPKSVGAVIVEITDRQKAEEALKINMERFQQLVENIHEVFYIYSPDWKRIEYISPLYESLWGHTCKSLYEQPLSFIDSIHPDDREQIIKVRHKTETNSIRSEAEYRIIRPDDTTRWIHDRNFIVYDIAGKPSRIVGIAEDITERKLSEQHMSLQYNITKIISESANIDEAISDVIQVICKKTAWDIGAFWVHDKINNQLYCSNIWHKPSVNVPEFLAICKRTASTPGTGFIGRIFTSGEPIWNVDIISDTYFQRRHTAKSEGINSAFGFPIKIENEKIGVLEFFSKQTRNPDDGLLNIITSISRQIGQFILRKQAENEIKHRIDFESVVARVSSRFVNISDFDVAVNESLADIGKFSGADRSYLFQFRENGTIMDNTHEWCNKGVSPEIKNLQNLPASVFPWFMSRIQTEKIVHIADVSQMPAEASAEKTELERQQIKAILILAIYTDKEFIGFVGFDNITAAVPWREENITLLNITAEILGNAFVRKQNEELIKHMAYHDALTNLPNRNLLQDRLQIALAITKRHKRTLSVMMLDLDNFKTVNDILGHQIGDLLLKATAERLVKCMREDDTISRIGGDEFIIVLQEIAQPQDAAIVAQKICNVIFQPFWIESHKIQVSASIGISIYPQDATILEQLIKMADIAMYQSKKQGKNTYQFYTAKLS